jgi:hypothetical protein
MNANASPRGFTSELGASAVTGAWLKSNPIKPEGRALCNAYCRHPRIAAMSRLRDSALFTSG